MSPVTTSTRTRVLRILSFVLAGAGIAAAIFNLSYAFSGKADHGDPWLGITTPLVIFTLLSLNAWTRSRKADMLRNPKKSPKAE